MLGRFLQTITDPEDYLAAIATLQPEPMTQESAAKAMQVYAKYLPHGTEPGHAKLCMAVDLMVGRTEEDDAFFAPLGLNAKELHALFAARAGGPIRRPRKFWSRSKTVRCIWPPGSPWPGVLWTPWRPAGTSWNFRRRLPRCLDF